MKKVICVLLLLVMLSSASYAVERFKITVYVSPERSGKVIMDPEMPAEGYLVGTEVTLTAIAKRGYRFLYWQDDNGYEEEDAMIKFTVEGGGKGSLIVVFESTGDGGLFSCVKPSGDETNTTRKILGDWLLLGVSCMTLLGMSCFRK